MSDFLETMARSSRARADAIDRTFCDADFDLPVAPLSGNGFDLIAEIKERSPSAGALAENAAFSGDRAARARAYVRGGAAAVSVLTEPDRFGGALAHLAEIAHAVAPARIPVMRKDFLVDRRQVLEARAAGASGVLLIVAMLDERQLADLLACAFEHSMFVLLEAFDEADLGRIRTVLEGAGPSAAAARRQLLVGVNVRDLRTLAVDGARLSRLAPQLPDAAVCVAESGLSAPADAAAAAALGYRMGLVGTALMRAADPAALVAELLRAGRAQAAA